MGKENAKMVVGSGEPGPGRPKGVKVVQVPRQLRDMREVYRTEKPQKGKEREEFPNDSPGVAQWRTLCRTEPKAFLQALQKAEEDYRGALLAAKKQADAKAEPGERDSAGVKIVETIEKLLAEWEEINGQGEDVGG